MRRMRTHLGTLLSVSCPRSVNISDFVSYSTSPEDTPSPAGDGTVVSVLGGDYPTDSLTNVTPTILERVGRQLHNQHQHPIEIIKSRIFSYFSDAYQDMHGRPLFSLFDDLPPVVSLEQNFDSLGVPPDHVTRSRGNNYYINKEYMLRAHTSAHQRDTIKQGHSRFLVTGDVYRRDEIDTHHYPVFHQMEGVELFTADELLGSTNPKVLTDLAGIENDRKQAEYGLAAVEAVERNLKWKLERLMCSLFGANLEMRWSETYFPFTHPSYEMEIYWNERWLEVLGSGIMRHQILLDGGVRDKIGYAFGLGLERLAMILFSIPDIRLFWSRDNRFLDQFSGVVGNKPYTFKPFSKHPPMYRDIAFWLKGEFEFNDFNEIIREEAGDWVESVKMLDEFETPGTGEKSLCYRVTYRCMERTLDRDEVQMVHTRVRDRVDKELSICLR